jgi:hypothetical protein
MIAVLAITAQQFFNKRGHAKTTIKVANLQAVGLPPAALQQPSA